MDDAEEGLTSGDSEGGHAGMTGMGYSQSKVDRIVQQRFKSFYNMSSSCCFTIRKRQKLGEAS